MSDAAATPRALLERLLEVLGAERDALRALDPEGLVRATTAKEGLAAAVVAARAAFDREATGADARALRVLAARVQVVAHANQILLDDAIAALRRRLGIADAGLYDARARRRITTAPPLGARTI
ncbi:MAG: hypothetical protein H6709_21040 [Kofleriaceae bacterium]|nr:hypothetical protein [Kofleriaceae bacterium]MCB9574570.1 hypothetical protein [Kofleriaceae bacterium]